MFKHIPINDSVTEAEKTRDIFVVVLQPDIETPLFELDKHYCEIKEYPVPLLFNLHYMELSLVSSRPFKKFIDRNKLALFNGNNRMLIFISDLFEKQMGRELIIFVNKLIQILLFFQIQITLYSSLPGLHLEKQNFYPRLKNVYNIRASNNLHTNFIKNKFENLKVIYFNTIQNPESKKITCQEWFQFFVANINKCGFGRMRQFSGSCYFNVFINMIVFSSLFKRIVIEKMNEYILQHPDSVDYIRLPLVNVQTCPNLSGVVYDSQLRYIYRLVYNLTCRPEKAFAPITESSKEDVLLAGAQEFFSAKSIFPYTQIQRKLLRSNSEMFEGGDTLFILINFLYFSKINFAIALKDGPEMQFFRLEHFTEEMKSNYRILYNYLFYKIKHLPHFLHPIREITDIDLIVYLPIQEESYVFYPDFKIIKNFSLQAAEISIFFDDDVPHAVAGVFCEGIPKIYDSNKDMPIEMNWTAFRVKEHHHPSIKTYNKRFYPLAKIISFEITSAIFVNNSFHKRLKFQQQMCLDLMSKISRKRRNPLA
jgi:hypothetical protein